MTDTAWHALVIVSFLLVGVPSNVAVLWIHTRKNSRVAKNKFPLIFAAIDLFALLTSLPFLQFTIETRGEYSYGSIYLDVSAMFAANGYLMALFMATIDKFYAVMFPFNYGPKRATIFRTAVSLTTIPNAAMAITLAVIPRTFGQQGFELITLSYNVIFALMFLTTNLLYVLIIAKLIRNQRSLGKVNNDSVDP